ncbi:MAG: BON domain-containing protein [Longimicrobiales bacterium]|nr:BON domain-containing protein [Longimicrobiales bacterium]
MASKVDRTLWILAAAAGAAAGLWLWRRRTGEETAPAAAVEGDGALAVARAYREDIELAAFDLAVNRISHGVIEITGAVERPDQRERAVAMAHSTEGIHTVVNRIVLDGEEARLEEAAARHADDPIRHTGMGVGMGTRRQSPDTDPDRPSDRQKLVERELEVRNLEVEEEPER